MQLGNFIQSISTDLYSYYGVPVGAKKINQEPKDYHFHVYETQTNKGLIGMRISLKWRRLIISMQPLCKFLPSGIYETWKNNYSENSGTFEYFETALKELGCDLTYQLNGKNCSDLNSENTVWTQLAIKLKSGYIEVYDSFDIHYENFSKIINLFWGLLLCIAGTEELLGYEEGNKEIVESIRYERNPINRRICIDAYGCKCAICGFDFETHYGELGKNFIEVHHVEPISQYGSVRIVNPLKDLIPLCSNCHSMIHRKNPPLTIDELRAIVNKMKEKEDGNGNK